MASIINQYYDAFMIKYGDTVYCGFRRKLPPIPEITLPLIPSSNSLVDSNTKVAGLRQLFA
jgi:hypothetical protein